MAKSTIFDRRSKLLFKLKKIINWKNKRKHKEKNKIKRNKGRKIKEKQEK